MPDRGRAGGRTVVAMSGGVDSSVAAALSREAGEDVVGLSMQLYDVEPGGGGMGSCCTPDDLRDARAVALRLGIPHYVMGFQDEFRRHVLDYFEGEYRRGRTPIPCIPCNSALKFGRLLDRAGLLGADRVATGHYARVEFLPGRGRFRLRAAVDAARDQSYFLFDLTQEQLARAVFPLGQLRKTAVRDLARTHGIPTAEKPESRDLCFVGSGTYRDRLPRVDRPGWIVDRSGRRLAPHGGVSGFTVGQRRGLGIASSRRLYVLAIDPERRVVTVGGEEEQYAAALEASGANWIAESEPAPFRAHARIRYRHDGAAARVLPGAGGRFRVEFDEPQRAITPGQAVVLYRGDEVLGGGWIDRADALTTRIASATLLPTERA
ncbi:MAG: tRNA 2-thiouridine(34) synthase MnmA [Acidobacteriota bacterium]|jgi:tRNA-specific 2-thiouridylase